jgi:hypothetical protein
MSLSVVLAVGMDPWLLAAQSSHWKSAGYVVVPASSTKEAIDDFKAGDFDLVMLGQSVSAEQRQLLTFLIRDSGSRTPVACPSDSSYDRDSSADAALVNESKAFLTGIGELLNRESRKWREQIITSAKRA